jgi:MoaA/NifB/PqqE/SkfB family radical SAM enzyme
MFKFNQLKSIHLEITNRCQARCPMCSRNIHGGVDNPNLVIADWTLDQFKEIITVEVATQADHIYFCGNFGDPIINSDLIPMCQHLTDLNPKLRVRIHTNGGARSTDWWAKLAKALPADHIVIFGIDGLEDTHHLYRIGTKFETVIKNAQAFMKAGGRAEWVFIKFKHNEHQADIAEQMAKDLGFSQFTMKNSNRFVGGPEFDVKDLNGDVIYKLQPPTDNVVTFIDRKVVDKLDDWVNTSTINCKAELEKEIYIDAHRQVYPCCFLASAPYYHVDSDSIVLPVKQRIVDEHTVLMNTLGSTLSSTDKSIQEILNSESWQTVWAESWENKRLLTCARICGTSEKQLFSKPADQFVKRVNLNE